MRHIKNFATINDLAQRARVRMPRCVWNYFYSGAGDNRGAIRNEAAFDSILFRAKRFRGAVQSTSVDLFGVSYNQPFGICPVGLSNIVWPGADGMMARLAAAKNVPHVLSTFASSSIEDMVRIAGDKLWFQAYLFREHNLTHDLLRRAWDAGVRVLVFTVDAAGERRHNMVIRGEHPHGLVCKAQRVADAALHPNWLFRTLSAGMPKLGNSLAYDAATQRIFADGEHDSGLNWNDLKRIRELWKGKLVVKGILEPDDAVRCVQEGADGIWVSTHGGRQLESLPASIMVLPALRDALGSSVPLMIDSGIRSGESVLKALALGADFAFLGRPFLFGAAAFGVRGVFHAYDLLAAEVKTGLMQIGCTSPRELDRSYLYSGPSGDAGEITQRGFRLSA